jgi:hypothetical protein
MKHAAVHLFQNLLIPRFIHSFNLCLSFLAT